MNKKFSLSRSFKIQAVGLTINGSMGAAALAKKLKVSVKDLQEWRRLYGSEVKRQKLSAKEEEWALKKLKEQSATTDSGTKAASWRAMAMTADESSSSSAAPPPPSGSSSSSGGDESSQSDQSSQSSGGGESSASSQSEQSDLSSLSSGGNSSATDESSQSSQSSSSESSKSSQSSSSSSGCGNPIRAFSIQQQQQDQWCWAAVAVSINWYYDSHSSWTQCIMANFEFDQHTCCNDGSTSACNRPHLIWTAMNDTGNLADGSPISGAASYDSITNEIDNCRPIGMGFSWEETAHPSTKGAHAVVISGYSSGTLYLLDPQGQTGNYFDYDDLISGECPYYELTITTWDETDFSRRSPY
jgi:transposase-like protein